MDLAVAQLSPVTMILEMPIELRYEMTRPASGLRGSDTARAPQIILSIAISTQVLASSSISDMYASTSGLSGTSNSCISLLFPTKTSLPSMLALTPAPGCTSKSFDSIM
uniref:Uncharacterized protein n=1 Tax=Arundo donax TaxID=35708 RepID=A0A0A9EPE4_ARUDO